MNGSNELRPVDPDRVRARRRLGSIFFVWLWEIACGLFVATPIHAWASKTWGSHPDGDSVLFRPGGHALLTWLGNDDAALAMAVQTSLTSLAVFAVIGQLLTGMLVAALAMERTDNEKSPPISFILRIGASSFLPILATSLLFGAVQSIVLGVGLFASSGVDRFLQYTIGDARSFIVHVVVLLAFLLVAVLVGILADFARVAIARDIAVGDHPAQTTFRMIRRALGLALHGAKRALLRAFGAWGWRMALSVALLYVGARAGDVVGERVGAALWLLFLVHQLVTLLRVGLRASWLGWALRLVAPAPEPPAT
jgi:hypothetical protein